jgi:hypothetical protein
MPEGPIHQNRRIYDAAFINNTVREIQPRSICCGYVKQMLIVVNSVTKRQLIFSATELVKMTKHDVCYSNGERAICDVGRSKGHVVPVLNYLSTMP